MVSDGSISNIHVNNFSLSPLQFSCLWLNPRQFFPQSLHSKNNHLRQTKKNQKTKKNFSTFKSSFWQPFSTIAKPKYFSTLPAKDFLREQCYSTTGIFCTKTTHVIGYKSLHRAAGNMGWHGIFQGDRYCTPVLWLGTEVLNVSCFLASAHAASTQQHAEGV